jgi:hypothetical protein
MIYSLISTANLLRCGDFMGYESLVKMYTQLYAMDQQENEAGS